MFQTPERLSASADERRPRHLLNRALRCAAGLLLLWVALQLFPGTSPASVPDVYADDSGAVATSTTPPTSDAASSLFSTGTLAALLLLCGGAAFAFYLRRRTNPAPGGTSLFEPLATYPLAPQQELRLVVCGDEVLLLGLTSGQVTLLKSYPRGHFDQHLAHETETSPRRTPHETFAFGTLLRQYAGRYAHTQ